MSSFSLIGLHPGRLSLPLVRLAPFRADGTALSSEAFLVNALEGVEVLPVSGRATFVVGVGGGQAAGLSTEAGQQQQQQQQRQQRQMATVGS